MEKDKQVYEIGQDFHLEYKPSKTYKVLTGCGNIYVTCDFKPEGKLHKIRLQRTSKLKCSPSLLHPLFSSATFQSRRDITQSIKDHKSNETDACDKYNITIKSAMKQGKLAAYNCSDAIARCLEIVLKENGDAIPAKVV